MIHTTLKAIRQHGPCKEGWEKLLTTLGKTKADDEPLPFLTILESNGLSDALWCLRVLPSEMDGPIRLLVCDFAEPALKYTTDPRPAEAIRVARAYARGEASKKELSAARAFAYAYAATTATASADAAAAAAWAASAASSAYAAARSEQTRIFRAWLDKTEFPIAAGGKK